MPDQKIVLITGGNGGIGYATAEALARDPSFHVIIGSRSLQKGQEALSKLSEQKGSVTLVQLDVTDPESVASAVTTVERDYGRLEVLVNNAAIGVAGPSMSAETLRYVFETNVFGVGRMTEAFLPLLRKSSNPRIVHVTSGLGSLTLKASGELSAPYNAYTVSKAALNMMALCHMEQFGDEIKVLVLTPGFVATNLGGDPEGWRKQGAEDPANSGKFIKTVIEGHRDSDRKNMLKEGGTFPW
ncbi:hypothetical protein H2200_004222 [Cladophialophora chaetospira]|uniref:Ketoreductase domain-containing protein n=1 Tax=Cladophialophora chaetospira TaxID=386627 RepID=A0AA38XFQ0_9EURO|nr:hypothetical protein H2200_004222 [Cladophialophora chaetospira]